MEPNSPPTPPSDQPAQQPVAYDTEGRPLYAFPPTQDVAAPTPVATPTPATAAVPPVAPVAAAETAPPQFVHVVRAVSPESPPVSDKVKSLHESSAKEYPMLNISEGEYVITSVKRHMIGLFAPLAVGTLLIAAALALLYSYPEFVLYFNIIGPVAEVQSIILPVFLFVGVVGLGMFIAYYVYTANKFYLTNESVIQEIQHSLFSRLEQTVSLASIEDASYTQVGILQQLLNYGDIRLSTEGDETTYRFSYVANPKKHIARLNDAVEAFKNGRPVGDD